MTKILNLKKKEIILYLIIFFISAHSFNFFYNIYFVSKNNYNARLTYHYGYCSKQSFGYINFLYDKFNFANNIEVLNMDQYPSSNWFFYDTNRPRDKEYIILLNYKEKLSYLNGDEINLNLKGASETNFQIIHNFENCFLLKKIK